MEGVEHHQGVDLVEAFCQGEEGAEHHQVEEEVLGLMEEEEVCCHQGEEEVCFHQGEEALLLEEVQVGVVFWQQEVVLYPFLQVLEALDREVEEVLKHLLVVAVAEEQQELHMKQELEAEVQHHPHHWDTPWVLL